MNNDQPILNISPTNNQYRHAAAIILERLKWDLKPQSWRSRKKLQALKDKYAGQKAVIVCNGPSLLKTNFELLDGVYTIGLNKINLLFDKSNFRPSCIVSVNTQVIEQNADFYNETDIPLFLDSFAVDYVKDRSNVHYLRSSSQVKFARDISMSVWPGGTVTFVALQLAFFLGFTKVGLIGCDHNFAQKGTNNKLVEAKGDDQSHFDSRYFSDGMKWHLPDLNTSEYGYYLAWENYNAAGRELYNCTEGGKLELFDRMPLADFIKR